MLFEEAKAVVCENYSKHRNIHHEQNLEFWRVKAYGTYSNRWGLKCESNTRS
jgi:hypothetical protein